MKVTKRSTIPRRFRYGCIRPCWYQANIFQIEEALKLYQTALKLHSQGPLSFVEARTAYDALFESEIFKYPESLPQPLRSEPVEPLDQASDDDDEYLDTQVISKTAVGGGVDGVPSTLPQILYLAFKNHGQFDLDHLKYKLESQRDVDGSSLSELKQDLEGAVARALVAFSAALARDESDLELWRRTARVGAAWGSTRLSRFCLEAVLDEREGFEGELGSLRLEEAIASEDLKEVRLFLLTQRAFADQSVVANTPRQRGIVSATNLHTQDPTPCSILERTIGSLSILASYDQR